MSGISTGQVNIAKDMGNPDIKKPLTKENVAGNLLPYGLITASIIIAALIFAAVMQDYLNQKLKNEAVTQCSQIATGQWTDKNTGAIIKEPYKPAYEKCLKDMGY